MQPPHLASGVAADPNSATTPQPDIAAANSLPFDARSLSITAIDHSLPAQPQPSAPAASTSFRGPILIQRVEPAYSSFATVTGVEGSVEVKAIIGTDGVPRQLVVIKGDPRLGAAAMDAIRRWRYQPALSGGNAVEAPITITMQFRTGQ